VTFAYCYPFTFTELIRFFENQEEILLRNKVERIEHEKVYLKIKTEKISYTRK
jgi:hypothetical protein